jgi:hypothetical protein
MINIEYKEVSYSTVQYNTRQYNTIQYNTIQCNPIQYNNVPYCTVLDMTGQDSTVQYLISLGDAGSSKAGPVLYIENKVIHNPYPVQRGIFGKFCIFGKSSYI